MVELAELEIGNGGADVRDRHRADRAADVVRAERDVMELGEIRDLESLEPFLNPGEHAILLFFAQVIGIRDCEVVVQMVVDATFVTPVVEFVGERRDARVFTADDDESHWMSFRTY